ncbi:RES domain-containing protein [Paraburkholderia caribensis]|uniref:RES domain-containing protein n=1 Tax=Paraburkholderia caribensis TaxID=75105 RepID=UPI0034D1DE53
MDDEDIEPGERTVCHGCVSEAFLSNEIAGHGSQARCYYCGERRNTVVLDQLAEWVEGALKRHFYRTSEEPDSYEAAMIADRESDYNWDRHGEPVVDVIASALCVEQEIAEDIRTILEDRNYDQDLAAAGVENPFDEEAHYSREKMTYPGMLHRWRQFEDGLHFKSRYFNSDLKAFLDRVFEGLPTLRTYEGTPVVVKAGFTENLARLYRARTFYDADSLSVAICQPDRELGPPPANRASAGRMNAQGISVFYGATVKEAALAEVRPPVGSRVLVAEFWIKKPLALLNLEALATVREPGSIFDPHFLRRREAEHFLRELETILTVPVMPSQEHLGYLTTQAVADYLANIVVPRVDGIIYPSVQVSGAKNVVLFHHAARVAAIERPKDAFVTATLYRMEEHGPEPDYVVEEWEAEPIPSRPNRTGILGRPRQAPPDARESTLQIIPRTLEVHEVSSITIQSVSFPVRQRRTRAPSVS